MADLRTLRQRVDEIDQTLHGLNLTPTHTAADEQALRGLTGELFMIIAQLAETPEYASVDFGISTYTNAARCAGCGTPLTPAQIADMGLCWYCSVLDSQE